MIKNTFTITNEQGLHMRPASMLTKALAGINCDVTIVKDGNNINAKSIMAVMAACIKCKTQVDIICDGPDEEKAMAIVSEMIENGFGE